MASSSDSPGAAGVYRDRAARFRDGESREEARSKRLSRARLAAFGAVVVAWLVAENASPGMARPAVAVAVLAAAAFVVLVALHRKVRRTLRRWAQLRALNEEGLARLARDWDALPDPGLAPASADHPYADDLDLFGRASLARLLGVVATAPGRATLRSWILEPAPPDQVRRRQVAVRELAELLELREELAFRGREAGPADAASWTGILRWAEGEPWLHGHRWLVAASRILPPLTLLLAATHLSGWTGPLWAAPGALSAWLIWRHGRRAHEVFALAGSGDQGVRRYGDALELLVGAGFRAPALADVSALLAGDGHPAHRQLRRLRRLLDMADLRYQGMAHVPLNLVFLWDLHVLHALERWQRDQGRALRSWLEGLGEVDALAGLAALAWEQPGWSLPELVEDGVDGTAPPFQARELGHPLIPPDRCVRNDVEIGPPGTFLLVTGSNMSGKSTLLRAVGLNAVLAQAGGPVCAGSLRLRPVAVHTSMRIRDSLEEGVSQFMAELRRLKDVVDAARRTRAEGGRLLLYLLDEVLQGTNTAERRVAARHILVHLLEQGAVGAVTTHDLSLAEAPELAGHTRPIHFRETVERAEGRPILHFDYTLRPGLATSTNALALMEVVGLGRRDGRPEEADAPVEPRQAT